MDNRPIGIFDSGLGGLTALSVFTRLKPCENIIYFGDSGRMPYGDKTVQELKRFAMEDLAFLKSHAIKALLVACGTLSSVAMEELQQTAGVPVVGVIHPAVQALVTETRTGRVGIIATNAAVRNGAYEAAVRRACPELEITVQACPEFAPMVDAGIFHPEDPQVKRAVEKNLRIMKEHQVDALLLGCTHYPALSPAISAYLGEEVRLVSNSAESAQALAELIDDGSVTAGDAMPGTLAFYTSGDGAVFSKGAEELLGWNISDVLTCIEPFDKDSAFEYNWHNSP